MNTYRSRFSGPFVGDRPYLVWRFSESNTAGINALASGWTADEITTLERATEPPRVHRAERRRSRTRALRNQLHMAWRHVDDADEGHLEARWESEWGDGTFNAPIRLRLQSFRRKAGRR